MPRDVAIHPAPPPRFGAWGLLPDPADLALLDWALLDWADPDPDARVLLIGPNCLELMCALIRRGSLDVSTVRPPDRPDARSADLVVIAHIGGGDTLACAIGHARRALAPFGSVVLMLSDHSMALAATKMLRRAGFSRQRQRGGMLRAELALEGGMSCA